MLKLTPQQQQNSVHIAPVRANDATELIAANCASRALHKGWVNPPVNIEDFAMWYDTQNNDSNLTLIVRESTNNQIAGVFNFSQIVMKAFQSAYLGYYGIAGFTGRGLMFEAINLVTVYGFNTIGLHRIEANIQPANLSSIALVKRSGFQKEGYSPRYLRVNGAWCDHERWALLSD
ncbi:GNAT family N-acetyltransferase [Pseudochrobactrum sp. MP213Fo]|uniref:GNAT family N-acetyltransferase n=1 Tax=Pseudochrobactrum sp. MP213Fo TaxID=3022250 RepID=UPI003BA02D67